MAHKRRTRQQVEAIVEKIILLKGVTPEKTYAELCKKHKIQLTQFQKVRADLQLNDKKVEEAQADVAQVSNPKFVKMIDEIDKEISHIKVKLASLEAAKSGLIAVGI